MAKNEDQLSKWSFLLGCVLSLIVGFVAVPYSPSILVILGLIVGFMGLSTRDTSTYLLAVIALAVIGTSWLANVQLLSPVSIYIKNILASFTTFVGVAGLVVAIKSIWTMGHK
ncbi:MAG TPA: hypothetical protein VJG90_02565 [Candidatus Nanoarchaeia archaeon]|nr:hypothetical protein [Candidatus Nanoarchaeia archaeon]